MTIIDRLNRSWHLTKKTFHIMKLDKEIFLLPIFSTITSIVLFIILIFPFVLSMLAVREESLLIYSGIFLFYFAAAFSSTFFNAALIHIVKTRFDGGDATLMDGLRAAKSHLGKIIGWSIITGTVGLILNILENQARENNNIIARIVVSLLGLAWGIVSLFVVPAMVIKGYGPIEALKKSVKTIKHTWGESLVKHVGVSIIRTLFTFLGVIFFVIPGIILFFSSPFIGGIFITVAIVYFILTATILSAANSVFDTALFVYADTGKIPSVYTEEEIKNAFRSKRGAR